MYKITFKLGDPSNDGHKMTEEYHILITHPILEVQKAYDKATEILGWDYLETVCTDYGDHYLYYKYYNDINNKLNIDISKCLPYSDSLEDLEKDGHCYLETDSFVEIYFEIISSQLKDFEWSFRDLEEELFEPLDGAGYGLFCE